MVCKLEAIHSTEQFKRMANVVCEISVTQAPLASRTSDIAGAGAILDFWGVVRPIENGCEIEGIDYEAHCEMAEHQLKRIAEKAAERFELKHVVLHHRIGFIAVDDASLFLRVASAHRSEGFRASQWIVDELKQKVPIWKRPWMALSGPTYGASLLRSLGIDDVTGGRGRYPEVTLDEVAALTPDLVVAPDEPYPFGERHRAELERVAPVVFVDGRDLLWWGERTRSATARLSALLMT